MSDIFIIHKKHATSVIPSQNLPFILIFAAGFSYEFSPANSYWNRWKFVINYIAENYYGKQLIMNKNNIKIFAEQEYSRWLKMAEITENNDLRRELASLSEEEMIDAFCTHLRFGTSGIRGVIGAGTNRMNRYVVRRATRGIAAYLNKCTECPSVVIAYDTRTNSRFFAEETAKVLLAFGIRTYLFEELATVSLLSFAVRKLNCNMGIMITASHNPKIFNGYKVYNSDGYQIVGETADAILAEIEAVDYFEEQDICGSLYQNDECCRSADILTVPPDIKKSFVSEIVSMCPQRPESDTELRLIYTPLNGTGRAYVQEVLKGIGFENFITVSTQEYPDENFTTCPTPNPEKITAFNEGFRVLDQTGGDLIIATDPDCDRVGVCVCHQGMKVLLTGNQLGALMLDYLCQVKPPKSGQFLVKSIVTTPLADRIAARYGLSVTNTLTGFKYIGEIITGLEKRGESSRYYFGFEESNGYLMNPFIRDKDGVSAAMLTVCMAAWYKQQGLDLIDRLHQIYEETGTCIDKTRNYFFEGPYGKAAMEQVMEHFRRDISDNLGGHRIIKKTDYLEATDLPKSNVLKFELDNGTQCMIRPSGTEAKIKVYYFETESEAELELSIKKVIQTFRTMPKIVENP